MQTTIRAIALLLFLVVAGCATAPQDPADTTTGEAGAAEEADTGSGAGTDGLDDGEGAQTLSAEDCPPDCPFSREAIDDSSSLLADRTVYFEFDSSSVQEKFMDTIRRHAAYLGEYTDVEVRLEGHTDERGSREYNVGLGARRADAVSRLLQAYGASKGQIETISYGEEVPAVEGRNEDAWAKNRRVEIVYPASGGSN